ncbi:MAG: LysM peptidoglycan-binding domain-containing protein [Firmicutes bacterium]|nr:LysM peptidoglycan-binding domain-containing protein [Bacillota bacterium]
MPDDYFYDLPASEIRYTLEEGDTYEDLARAFDTSVEMIAELNPELNMAQVTPGQELQLPFRPRFCPGGTIYIARRGDTLAGIAARFGTTEEALRRANPFLSFIRLRPGLPICIPPRPVACPNGFIHTIMAGDTLFSLAARFGTTVDAILRANPGLDPNRLFTGQQICIPVPRPQPGRCPGGFFYTIAAGDTLFSLANRFGTTVDAILRANPGLDPNRLFIGQQICIPVPRPQPGCPGGFIYTVVAGDTLNSIAFRFGVSVDAIIRANPGINPDFIVIGQQICIPRW